MDKDSLNKQKNKKIDATILTTDEKEYQTEYSQI